MEKFGPEFFKIYSRVLGGMAAAKQEPDVDQAFNTAKKAMEKVELEAMKSATEDAQAAKRAAAEKVLAEHASA